MNKINQITTFIDEENIDIAFISESHDRENMRLEDHFQLASHTVISNLYQRPTKEKEGRPVIIANKEKYRIENLTNTSIIIPWGVEMVWALLTPKTVSKDSVIKRVVLGAIYVKPKSKKITATLDHIAQVYNTLRTKYGQGLHWIVAGDTNQMKLGPILRLNNNLKSIVKNPTRINPKNPEKNTILDNIITDLHNWYQEPKCLPPIEPDNVSGKPSDHLTVICEPLNVINNTPIRHKRNIMFRPITDSGVNMFKVWIKSQKWDQIRGTPSVNAKVKILNNLVIEKVQELFPEKNTKMTSDDSPWVNDKVKKLKRLKTREYNKHRSSKKWSDLNMIYKLALIESKQKYYKRIVKDLKVSKPSQWYSKVKRICSYEQDKYEPINCEEIEHLSDQEQANKIAKHFCAVREKFEPLRKSDIVIPPFDEDTIPQFSEEYIRKKLMEINPRKSVPTGDIPPKLIKLCAMEFSKPLADVINASIKQGIWPQQWKTEIVTPVPKLFPPKRLKNLRSISGLISFNKIMEKVLSEIIISDMKDKIDPSQYGNQYGLSIQHYLINMINKILEDTDKGINAVLATFVDWKDAFPNQCHKLGIEAFIECGVRPSVIPVLINYFQDRSVIVKWHNKQSKERHVPGGGPQGAYIGNLEYTAQSNKSANIVKKDSRFKFVDDLTTLEKINLLMVGMASHNLKFQIPNDILINNKIIPPQHLK